MKSDFITVGIACSVCSWYKIKGTFIHNREYEDETKFLRDAVCMRALSGSSKFW